MEYNLSSGSSIYTFFAFFMEIKNKKTRRERKEKRTLYGKSVNPRKPNHSWSKIKLSGYGGEFYSRIIARGTGSPGELFILFQSVLTFNDLEPGKREAFPDHHK